MAIIHISEPEAAQNFASLIKSARSSAEVVIGDETPTPVLLHMPNDRPLRKLSDSIRSAREHASSATLDGGFTADLEAVVNSHSEPLNPPTL